jgi:antitoxin ParD1/3/4
MNITLTQAQETWIAARVQRGEFQSLEDAARAMIDAEIAAQAALEHDNMAWAKPYIDEAEAAAARGEVMSADESKARIAAQLAALRR